MHYQICVNHVPCLKILVKIYFLERTLLRYNLLPLHEKLRKVPEIFDTKKLIY